MMQHDRQTNGIIPKNIFWEYVVKIIVWFVVPYAIWATIQITTLDKKVEIIQSNIFTRDERQQLLIDIKTIAEKLNTHMAAEAIPPKWLLDRVTNLEQKMDCLQKQTAQLQAQMDVLNAKINGNQVILKPRIDNAN